MTKQQIIKELYDTNFVESYTAKLLVNRDDIPLEDAISHIWLIICELDEERMSQWYEQGGINKIRQVVAGIINRQCRSTSSSLYYTYVKKNVVNLAEKRTNDKRQHWDAEEGWIE